MNRLAAIPVVLLFVFQAWSCRGPAQSYKSFTGGAARLKQQFNADAGRTRIVILPAPN